jgi:hypothetical protein
MFKRKWEASSLVNPQTHLESVVILDRNRSYLSELQLRRYLAYKILCRLSPTKKWPWILASTTLLLRVITTRSSTYCYWVNCVFELGFFISRKWGKLSSRRERKKLCLMYNMYLGHAPSYLCDLLSPMFKGNFKWVRCSGISGVVV